MSSPYFQQIRLLVKRLLIVYLVYFFSRLLFFTANIQFFPSVNFPAFLWDAVAGLRFDTFAIVISNSLFILFSLFPLRVFWKPWYQALLRWIFMLCNSLFLVFNFIDIPYFPFIKKRSTSELFDQMKGQSDLINLIPAFAKDFWWVILLFILAVYLLAISYRKIKVPHVQTGPSPVRVLLRNWILFLLLAAVAVVGARGGLQRVPIDVVNAGSMTGPEEVPIVLNTPFTILKSLSQKSLKELAFYNKKEVQAIYNPIHHFREKNFTKKNVVVLILESFGKEYTGLGKTISVTPFLDSLMQHSLVFTNGFSNGTKSIEGIPAILSSLPSLMPDPFINSVYANNAQTSLATVLGREGYECGFFHGGINGTMNFDDWAALAGYKYYGKNEYDNDSDFDGYWGIWDEPFLLWSARQMDGFRKPFHSAIFTLSSHHPYFIPDKYKGKFKKTGLENSESIGYADHSLRLFFNEIKNKEWFTNTLFVLVADHTGISDHPFYRHVAGLASIPIVFYSPGDSLRGQNPAATSQVDILPSVLHLLGYNKPFFAFGDSYMEPKRGNDLLYITGTHFSFQDSMVYCYNMPELRQAYNFKRDSTLQNNILGANPVIDSTMHRSLKAFMQTYHSTIIHNSGSIK